MTSYQNEINEQVTRSRRALEISKKRIDNSIFSKITELKKLSDEKKLNTIALDEVYKNNK